MGNHEAVGGVSSERRRSSCSSLSLWFEIQGSYNFLSEFQTLMGTLGCVFIDNETHESGVTKCTPGEAWSAFSWHHSSVTV